MENNKKDTVLIVDDNEDDFRIISRYISDFYIAVHCFDQNQAVELIKDKKPICILLDYHLKMDTGINVLKDFKTLPEIKNIPVIMMTGEMKPDVIIQCMKNKADDYLIKGDYDKERINKAIEESIHKALLKQQIVEQQKQILKLSRTDSLTGVLSRHYILERVENEILKMKGSNTSLTLTLLDLDNFKEINDEYGHLTGDAVLIEMASIIMSEIREIDFIGRFGGDEFIIVLLNLENNNREITLEKHKKVIDEIRKRFSFSGVKHHGSKNEDDLVYFTSTFGMVFCDGFNTRFEDIVSNADVALYTAKKSGKNCMAIYHDAHNIDIF